MEIFFVKIYSFTNNQKHLLLTIYNSAQTSSIELKIAYIAFYGAEDLETGKKKKKRSSNNRN